MVGDCVGSSAGSDWLLTWTGSLLIAFSIVSTADVFESIAAEIIGAMILGSSVAVEAELSSPLGFIFFPLVIHALDIIVSSAGILAGILRGLSCCLLCLVFTRSPFASAHSQVIWQAKRTSHGLVHGWLPCCFRCSICGLRGRVQVNNSLHLIRPTIVAGHDGLTHDTAASWCEQVAAVRGQCSVGLVELRRMWSAWHDQRPGVHQMHAILYRLPVQACPSDCRGKART